MWFGVCSLESVVWRVWFRECRFRGCILEGVVNLEGVVWTSCALPDSKDMASRIPGVCVHLAPRGGSKTPNHTLGEEYTAWDFFI